MTMLVMGALWLLVSCSCLLTVICDDRDLEEGYDEQD